MCWIVGYYRVKLHLSIIRGTNYNLTSNIKYQYFSSYHVYAFSEELHLMRKSDILKFFFYYLQPRTWCVWSEALFTGSFLCVWEFFCALHAVFCSILGYMTWLGRHYVVLRHVKLDLLPILVNHESSSPGQHVIVIHITKVGFRVRCNCEIYPWVYTLFALFHETGGFDIPSAWSAWDYRSLNLLGSRTIVYL